MPINLKTQVPLHPVVASLVALYTQRDDELNAFYKNLSEYLKSGLESEIFPCQKSKIENVVFEAKSHAHQVTQDPQVVAITGRRALVALNGFVFGCRILEDEAFFCGSTLFMLRNHSNPQPDCQVKTKVQIYSKGKLTPHREDKFDTLELMNRHFALELLVLNCDKEFEALLVEVELPCPEMGRMIFAVAPRVDAAIKELLERYQTLGPQQPQQLWFMMHFFALHAGSASEVGRKAAEGELNYVSSMAERAGVGCQLLLLCEHRRNRRDEVVCTVQKYASSAVSVCYYTHWHWDGLPTVGKLFEGLLQAQLHKRCTLLSKRAIKALTTPFRVVHQIRREINVSKNNLQKRPESEINRDFKKLTNLAKQLSSDFIKLADRQIREVSELVAQHLRKGDVRTKVIKNILDRAAELKVSTDHKTEITFLEIVANEIRDWNSHSQVLTRADEAVQKTIYDIYHKLCEKADGIPEIILVGNDMLVTKSSESSRSSGDSDTKTSITSFIDDIVQRRLRAGRLENFAAGIAAPLWVPLAAITMAIIAPVIGTQRRQQSDENFRSNLRGAAHDFLDRLDNSLIEKQFLAKVRERMDEDAKKVKDFIVNYCILPVNFQQAPNLGMTDNQLMQNLVNLEGRLQNLHSTQINMQVMKLGCDILTKQECETFGVDPDVDSIDELGEEIEKNNAVYLVAPPNSASKPLVLKVAPKRENLHQLLLEIDVLKTVSKARHSNIIPWLGTVYFPKLQTVGFLTNKCDFNLWQFLNNYSLQVVPSQYPFGSSQHDAAFALCRNMCDQIFAGVHQLHVKLILHRDLKPENVLIDVESPQEPLRFVAKLCDFGMAKHESELSGKTFGGTKGYMAPEIEGTIPLFSNKSDIYSLGIITWECYFGRRARDEPGALETHTTGNSLWNYLVKSMTAVSPNSRPLIEQCRAALRHFEKKEPDGGIQLDLRIPSMPTVFNSLKTLSRSFDK